LLALLDFLSGGPHPEKDRSACGNHLPENDKPEECTPFSAIPAWLAQARNSDSFLFH
jgi:hypothetical protein